MQVVTIFVQLLYQKTLMLILYLPQLFVQSDFNVTITPQNMQVIIRKTGELIIALANYADVFRYKRRYPFSVLHKNSLFYLKKANKYSTPSTPSRHKTLSISL
jgi:hypothetical protein